MKIEDTIIKLITKYDFRKEIPADVRDRIIDSKEKIHDEILVQKCGESGYRIRGRFMFKNTFVMASAAAVAVIMTASIFLMMNGFKWKGADSGVVTARAVFVTGDVTVRRGDNSVSLKSGESVSKGDLIVTGVKSTVSLQIEGVGIVTLIPETECSFNEISQSGKTEVGLKDGSVYSSMKKLSRDQGYSVKTSTYTASVRGTEFMTSAGKSNSVRVLAGVVSVASAKSSIDVEKESGARVGNEGEVTGYKLNRIELLELKKYSLYKYIENLKDRSGEYIDSEQKEIERQIAEIDAEIAALKGNDSREPVLSPLDRLRKAGKPLTMIYLRDGSQIAGSVSGQRNGKLRLDTGDGIINIPVNDIIRRMPIK